MSTEYKGAEMTNSTAKFLAKSVKKRPSDFLLKPCLLLTRTTYPHFSSLTKSWYRLQGSSTSVLKTFWRNVNRMHTTISFSPK